MFLNPCDKRHKGCIEEQHPVLRVVDDIGQLIGKQARVDRVQDKARAGNAVVQLQMAAVVPGQCSDPVLRLQSQLIQRRAHSPRIAGDFGPGGFGHRAICFDRDDPGLAVIAFRVIDQ